MPPICKLAICIGAAAMSFAATDVARGDLPVRELAPGIYYGPPPRTAADYGQLRGLGVKTLLDLRKFWRGGIEDTRQAARHYGFAWRQAPIGFRPLRDGSPECALRVLADKGLRPVYFFCNLGKDRTGLVVALYRVRNLGWRPWTAFRAFKRQQFNPRMRGLDAYFWGRTRASGSRQDRVCPGRAAWRAHQRREPPDLRLAAPVRYRPVRLGAWQLLAGVGQGLFD